MPDFPLTRDTRNKKVRTQHVEGIHKKKAEVANQIGANSSPKCGGELITRKGNYGDFKGCNNYPKCRFIITS
ncbi:MAG: topoisomerase DNA-binding C4 zinc finger domain-containing protein [Desulfitobacteriaceae bacterium]